MTEVAALESRRLAGVVAAVAQKRKRSSDELQQRRVGAPAREKQEELTKTRKRAGGGLWKVHDGGERLGQSWKRRRNLWSLADQEPN